MRLQRAQHKRGQFQGKTPRSGSYKVLRVRTASVLGMWGKTYAALALLAGLPLAAGACAPSVGGIVPEPGWAATDQTSVSAATPQSLVPQQRASRIAQSLAQAETAFDQAERARLSELVSGLYASGLTPLGESQTDLLGKWAAASGDRAMPYRGRLLGPAYVRGELAPGEVWTSAQTFKSGEPSTLAVSHKGSGPVSISVSDQTQRRVCKADRSRSPSCSFTPLYTQRYSIELVNQGSARAVYFLVFD